MHDPNVLPHEKYGMSRHVSIECPIEDNIHFNPKKKRVKNLHKINFL
jgi:hypothetical protein